MEVFIQSVMIKWTNQFCWWSGWMVGRFLSLLIVYFFMFCDAEWGFNLFFVFSLEQKTKFSAHRKFAIFWHLLRDRVTATPCILPIRTFDRLVSDLGVGINRLAGFYQSQSLSPLEVKKFGHGCSLALDVFMKIEHFWKSNLLYHIFCSDISFLFLLKCYYILCAYSCVVSFGVRVCLSSISFLKRLVSFRCLVCVLLIFFLFRSLLVMLDSLLSDIHLSSSLTQTWLLHSIQRGDLMRILEPLLLILFHPDTARLGFTKEPLF